MFRRKKYTSEASLKNGHEATKLGFKSFASEVTRTLKASSLRKSRRHQISSSFTRARHLMEVGQVDEAIGVLNHGLRLANDKLDQCKDNQMGKSCRDFTRPHKMKMLLLRGVALIIIGQLDSGFEDLRWSLKMAQQWKKDFGKCQ